MSKGNIHAYNESIKGVWLTVPTKNKTFEALEVLVKPQPINSYWLLQHGDMLGYIVQCVLDWNLNDNGKKIECNEENKKHWLDIICQWPAAAVKHSKLIGQQKQTSVGAEIVAFCANFDNFTKN